MADVVQVFDRRAVRGHKDRAARTIEAHEFLIREVAERLADRLDDVNRDFPLALDLGCHTGTLARALEGRGGIRTLIQCDMSFSMVTRAQGMRLAADEELLPFANADLDLVMSCLSLHWVNDLPGTLVQVRRALQPDGLFLAALFGGETLKELRQAFLEAELAEKGGASPHVSPFADIRDGGDLLQRAGFALPVADTDTIVVTYDNPFRLLHDLRKMGETNAVASRSLSFCRRQTLMRMAQIYRETFATGDGLVPATFQVVYLTGWAPARPQIPLFRQRKPESFTPKRPPGGPARHSLGPRPVERSIERVGGACDT